MKFKNWLIVEEQEITQPYYRVVNPAYGSKLGRGDAAITNPGTYWTPRWDSVIMMLQTTIKYLKGGKETTTVYQIDKAIMTDAPPEHKWAFSYGVDAGEQVLVKALETPKVATDPKTHILIKDLTPYELIEIVLNYNIKPPVDWEKRGIKADWKGKEVFIGWNYDDFSINLYEKDGWQFKLIKKIFYLKEWNSIEKELKFNYNDDNYEGLMWFLIDARENSRWK